MPTYADIQGARALGRMADAQPDRVTMRLLVIEDDRDAADYLVKAFREVGHVAYAYNDGEDGLAMALDGQYDVLIVDRMLPKRDGLSLIGTLRDKGIETPARRPLTRSSTWPSADKMSAGVSIPLSRRVPTRESPSRLGSMRSTMSTSYWPSSAIARPSSPSLAASATWPTSRNALTR